MALTNPDPTSPLNTPSHAALHVELNSAVSSLGSRMTAAESELSTTSVEVEQARRVSNTWVVNGTLDVGATILPVLWNLTPRAVKFEAAKASVITAPTGSSIIVDIVVGTDPAIVGADSIFTSKLVIPAGSTVSQTISSSGFVTPDHDSNVFVRVVILQVGSSVAGSGLSVQLNRLL